MSFGEAVKAWAKREAAEGAEILKGLSVIVGILLVLGVMILGMFFLPPIASGPLTLAQAIILLAIYNSINKKSR